MTVIDADTHVEETDETWSYLRPDERWFAPKTVVLDPEAIPLDPGGDGLQVKGTGFGSGDNRYWLFVDGAVRPRLSRKDDATGATQATRQLTDVAARLRHMDELGTDIHVMFTSCFLHVNTVRQDVEAGLCRSYNHWMAEKCAKSGGRLRWVAVLPLLNMEATLEQVRFAKEQGAVAVMMKGFHFGRPAGDPYFYPLYQLANDLDISVCVHTGAGDPNVATMLRPFVGLWPSVAPVLDACVSLLLAGVPDRFPKLRVGFIEAGASWVPFVLSYMWARRYRMAQADMTKRGAMRFDDASEMFRASRFYVAYQTYEDLDYLIANGLEDCLVIGTDYTHVDQSAELRALCAMQERAERGEVSSVIVRKMLDDNPRSLYGL